MRLIVADAGPLIALSRIHRLSILRTLFDQVAIPRVVVEELRLDERRPGVEDLARAVRVEKWLQDRTPRNVRPIAGLDEGESAAIHLAEELRCPLLIDEHRGRISATKRGVAVIGTGRILIEAKRRGLIANVAHELGLLRTAGYRLSEPLCRRILSLASE